MSLEDKIRQLDDDVTATVQDFVERLHERFHQQLESGAADMRQAVDRHLQQGIDQLRETVSQQLHHGQETLRGYLRQVSAELPQWLPAGGAAAEPAAGGADRPSSWTELRDALVALDRAANATTGRQQQVLATLLEQCAPVASRAALFLLRSEQLVGWGGFGFSATELAALRGQALASDPTGAWQAALSGASCVLLGGEDCARLCRGFGAEPGTSGVLVPLVLRDRVAALLYADRREPAEPLEVTALQVLVWAAAQTIEVLPFRQRAVTGTLVGDQPAPQAPPARPRLELADVPAPVVAPVAEVVAEVEVAAEPALAVAEPVAEAEDEVEEVEVEPAWATEVEAEPVLVAEPASEAGPEMIPVVPTGGAVAPPPVVLEPEPEPEALSAELVAEPEPEPEPEPEVVVAEPAEPELAVEDAETSKLFDAEPGTIEPAPDLSPLSTMRWDAAPFQAQLERAGLTSPPPAPEPEAAKPDLDTAREIRYEPVPPAPPPSQGATILMERPELVAPPVAEPAADEAPTAETPVAGGGLFGGGETGKEGKPAQVAPPQDVEGPGRAFAGGPAPTNELDAKRQRARRLARLLVSEIKLYNEEQVEEGRRLGNVYSLLKEDIDRSRQMYNERTDSEVRAGTDYFHEELVRMLAGGDSTVLGI